MFERSPEATPTPPPKPRSTVGHTLLLVVLGFSILFNLVMCIALGTLAPSKEDQDGPPLLEKFFGGKDGADERIAIVRVEGLLMDGLTNSIKRQVERASTDPSVKAVVLRIDSPGGTITASEEVHRLLVELRDGTSRRFQGEPKPKPLIASFGGIAASGGYYVAMPAKQIFAERTTITGSIGVYAALPNAAKLAKENGVSLELIKAGDIKASGSLLHTMTPQERQPWQEMVDAAYERFLEVVADGRGIDKERLRGQKIIDGKTDVYDEKGNKVLDANKKPVQVAYSRVRADGGTFTAAQAKQFGLVDEIGDIFAALDAAAKLAGIGEYQAFTYERRRGLLDHLLGVRAERAFTPVDWAKLPNAAVPRLWYLAPNSEMAGLLTTLARD